MLKLPEKFLFKYDYYERRYIIMKKVILTIAALAVSAAMVFSFAGCTENPTTEEESSDAVVAEVESEA